MRFTTVLAGFAMFMVGMGFGVAVGARVVPDRGVHVFDLTDPWERCLSAMESAEIPPGMWECHEEVK